jgi:peptide/nickel transport system ATP-binding protein
MSSTHTHKTATKPVSELRPPGATALVVEGLRVDAPGGIPIVEDVSLHLEAGTILGVVGESGSGKTTMALALLGYTQGGARIAAGQVTVADTTMDLGSEKGARHLRGKLISYVPQNPGNALDPSSRIGAAIEEMIHARRADAEPQEALGAVMSRVGLPSGIEFRRRYPHQLSGGQQQRVCIAISLVGQPPVVVLDEPTTGLDVVTQARILEELIRLAKEQGVAMVYVTHDLAVVAQISDRIAVMYAGGIVEQGPARQVLGSPKHPYTRGLIRSIPDHLRPGALQPLPGVAVGIGDRPPGCAFEPRCSLSVNECSVAKVELLPVGFGDHHARCIRTAELTAHEPAAASNSGLSPERTAADDVVLDVRNLRAEHRSRAETVVAAEDISFQIRRGACVALVGESGSGKTTIARTIAGLHPIAGGRVELGGKQLPANARHRSREDRRRIQIVFQNPADALNPRESVGSAIARPARLLRGLDKRAAEAEVARLLDLARLPQRTAGRLPAHLSGGEKQRVGIARALAADPSLIVCDEITSALDVSVQAAILDLLSGLQRELGLGLLFITHDLGVVASIAEEVLVLENGKVAEQGATLKVLRDPAEPYTKRLLAAAPSVSHAVQAWKEHDEAGGHHG